MLLFLLEFHQDFVRSERGLKCDEKATNVFEQSSFMANANSTTFTALESCERYCAAQKTCKACNIYCDGTCQWKPISRCSSYLKWMGFSVGDISQKLSMYLLRHCLSPYKKYFWRLAIRKYAFDSLLL